MTNDENKWGDWEEAAAFIWSYISPVVLGMAVAITGEGYIFKVLNNERSYIVKFLIMNDHTLFTLTFIIYIDRYNTTIFSNHISNYKILIHFQL